MRKTIIFLLLLPALLGSCNAVSSLIHDDQVVAKVGKNKLYKSEVERFIPNMVSPEDSARLAEQYINSWAMDLLYLDVAERELSKGELDVSVELEDFRRSLLKYRYEQRYINDRLDTLVTDEQIRSYYEEHQSDFDLKRPVLKVRFVDVMKDSPKLNTILRMMSSLYGFPAQYPPQQDDREDRSQPLSRRKRCRKADLTEQAVQQKHERNVHEQFPDACQKERRTAAADRLHGKRGVIAEKLAG